MIIKGDIDLTDEFLEKLPDMSESIVYGNFRCSKILTSLEGAPQKVGGSFDCSSTAITTLEGAPKYVGGDFDCLGCFNLASAKGLPMHIGGILSYVDEDKFYQMFQSKLKKREKLNIPSKIFETETKKPTSQKKIAADIVHDNPRDDINIFMDDYEDINAYIDAMDNIDETIKEITTLKILKKFGNDGK